MCDVHVYNASMQSFIIFCYGTEKLFQIEMFYAFVTEQQTNYISENIEYSLH